MEGTDPLIGVMKLTEFFDLSFKEVNRFFQERLARFGRKNRANKDNIVRDLGFTDATPIIDVLNWSSVSELVVTVYLPYGEILVGYHLMNTSTSVRVTGIVFKGNKDEPNWSLPQDSFQRLRDDLGVPKWCSPLQVVLRAIEVKLEDVRPDRKISDLSGYYTEELLRIKEGGARLQGLIDSGHLTEVWKGICPFPEWEEEKELYKSQALYNFGETAASLLLHDHGLTERQVVLALKLAAGFYPTTRFKHGIGFGDVLKGQISPRTVEGLRGIEKEVASNRGLLEHLRGIKREIEGTLERAITEEVFLSDGTLSKSDLRDRIKVEFNEENPFAPA